jgi:CRP-like cAMP-binding protein
LKRIDYLDSAPPQLISNLCFAMEMQSYEEGTVLQKQGDKATEMIIVFSGMLEITTEMDNGTEFVIEMLP